MPTAAQDNVWIKRDEMLHKIMDKVEAYQPIFKELQEGKYGEKLTALEQGLVTMNERLLDYDKRLPFGSKVYIPAHGDAKERLKGRGLLDAFVSDVMRMKFGAQPVTFDRKQMRYTTDGSFIRADQSGGTTTAGGFVIPEEVLPEVVALIGEVGVARNICRIIPMGRKDMKVPTRNTGPLVYWPGEGVKPTTSNVSLLRPELNSKTLLALDEISEELDMDSLVPMTSLLVDLFTEAVALEEDTQVFSSTVPFSGVLQTTSVNDVSLPATKTAQNQVDYNDMVGLKHGVNSKVVGTGVFVMHQDQIANLLKIKDTTNNPIWRDAPNFGGAMAAGPAGMILGMPFYTTNAMPSATNSGAGRYFAVYGDFKRYWAIGDRMTMQVDVSTEAGFTTFTRFMRVAERVAMVSIIPAAFARLRTANS